MSKKVLFWIDQDFTHFGIAKFMQEKYDYEMYAIYDVYEKAKKFFEKQKLVNFKNSWYYRDAVSGSKRDINFEYLINFEKKYEVDLWKMALTERVFLDFNQYYSFSDLEILSILETECRFFEKILEEIKPDVLCIKVTDMHHNHLISEICKNIGIKVLMLNPTRYANKSTLLKEKINSVNYQNTKELKFKESEKRITQIKMEQEDYKKSVQPFVSYLQVSKIEMLKAMKEFFLTAGNSDYRKSYTNYGKTRYKIFFNELIKIFKMKYRKFFIDKNLIKKIRTNESFVYYPLHHEPERSILISSPYHTNQIELILHIAKSLPINYKLFVKEHPSMKKEGWRDPSFYKKIMKIPNVYLFHPDLDADIFLQNSSLIATISGTAVYEAMSLHKNAIVFSNIEYPSLSSIYKITKLEELPKIIKSALNTKHNLSEYFYFLDVIEENSFDFDWFGFRIEFRHEFYYGGFLADAKLPEKKVETILEKYREDFENAAYEHNKIIEVIN